MGERRALPLRHGLALGLLHGPTELLPISSAGHTTLVPWLARWPYTELDSRQRKTFEVALHAGTVAALLVRPPCDTEPRSSSQAGSSARSVGAKLAFLAPALVPPALTGYAMGEQIARRLGTPRTIAAGLLAGSAAMLAADRYAGNISRPAASAGALDGLALGLAQALALMPGVSRSGTTLATARARGFSRRDADRLSWKVGMPVIAGAALLRGMHLAREGTPRELRLPLAVGAVSAFLSTLASTTVLSAERRARLLPTCAAYRGVLALLVIRRMRDNTS